MTGISPVCMLLPRDMLELTMRSIRNLSHATRLCVIRAVHAVAVAVRPGLGVGVVARDAVGGLCDESGLLLVARAL
eukprot:13372993-Alexandrium_andersonii.AAC.1